MKNKVAFITGASSGIGRQLALEFAHAGSDLILTARRLDLLQALKTECEALGVKCSVYVMDMEQRTMITEVAGKALKEFGRIDIVVHNAGISQRASAAETSIEVVRRMMEINFFSALELNSILLPEIRRNKGNICVISSMSGLFGFHGRSAYSAGKFALMGYFETLAVEEPEISVTLVCPGRIKTDISLSAFSADGTAHGKMDKGQLDGISVEKCASLIYNAIKHKKTFLIIAGKERILFWIKKISHSLFIKTARKAKNN